jgi:hypothetical protein
MEAFSNSIASQSSELIDAHPGAKRLSNRLTFWLASTPPSLNQLYGPAPSPDQARVRKLASLIRASRWVDWTCGVGA